MKLAHVLTYLKMYIQLNMVTAAYSIHIFLQGHVKGIKYIIKAMDTNFQNCISSCFTEFFD